MRIFTNGCRLYRYLSRKRAILNNGSISQINGIHDIYFQQNDRKSKFNTHLLTGLGIGSYLAYLAYDKLRNRVELKEDPSTSTSGAYRSDLPDFTLENVRKHDTIKENVWVTYKQGVYDVTKFVQEHPGGDIILMAAGCSVEPFWLLYAAHNTTQVYEILEKMRIGNISLEESKEAIKNMSDPYANDPVRHKVLKPASAKPFNAEAPLSLLAENYYTPNDLFYVRNHLPVPEIESGSYQLEVEVGGQKKRLTLTLEQIQKLPRHTVTATIMCAGNRRSEMTKVKPVKGLSWGAGAIGNAKWTGARLRDVLKSVGITEDSIGDYKHVKFEGLDLDTTGNPYGASIPIWKAVDKRGDVILAYEMNGEPIPRDHGYPIRVVVPGVVGARNVKWLGKIEVSKEESKSHWQQNDYKGFSPSTDWDTVDFSTSPAIQELPVISAICKPTDCESILMTEEFLSVHGYAWSGGGCAIVRVDVTIDGGKTWHVATLHDEDENSAPQHYGWALWSVKVPIKKGCKCVQIWSKAVDSNYNVQPESFDNIWNLRGVLNNAYHRISVQLKW